MRIVNSKAISCDRPIVSSEERERGMWEYYVQELLLLVSYIDHINLLAGFANVTALDLISTDNRGASLSQGGVYFTDD